jgi:hypothetical protein
VGLGCETLLRVEEEGQTTPTKPERWMENNSRICDRDARKREKTDDWFRTCFRFR